MEKEEKDKKIVPFGTEILKGTNERVKIGFGEGGKIHLELENYSDRRKIPYPQSPGIETLPDARGQTLKFWYEKNPTTNELLWSIGINGLDENKLIKTKTMLINSFVFKQLMKIGTQYLLPNTAVSKSDKQIEKILNEKNGYGLSKLLLNNELITVKEYSKKFKLKTYTAREQLKRFEQLGLIKEHGKTKGRMYKLHISKDLLRRFILI